MCRCTQQWTTIPFSFVLFLVSRRLDAMVRLFVRSFVLGSVFARLYAKGEVLLYSLPQHRVADCPQHNECAVWTACCIRASSRPYRTNLVALLSPSLVAFGSGFAFQCGRARRPLEIQISNLKLVEPHTDAQEGITCFTSRVPISKKNKKHAMMMAK